MSDSPRVSQISRLLGQAPRRLLRSAGAGGEWPAAPRRIIFGFDSAETGREAPIGRQDACPTFNPPAAGRRTRGAT